MPSDLLPENCLNLASESRCLQKRFFDKNIFKIFTASRESPFMLPSKKTKARALVFVISDISVCNAQKKKLFISEQYYFKAAFFNLF